MKFSFHRYFVKIAFIEPLMNRYGVTDVYLYSITLRDVIGRYH